MINCDHSVRLKDICAICGEELFNTPTLFNPLLENDALKVTKSLNNKRPVLVVDLDHTIIFTSLKLKSKNKITLHGIDYCVFKRRFLRVFLRKISKCFKLIVYTLGTREYANKILEIIDKDSKIFKGRIISRDENENKLTKNINRTGMRKESVIIIDDRFDVWDYEENLLLVKPFVVIEELDFNDPAEIKKQSKEIAAGGDPLKTMDANLDAINKSTVERATQVRHKDTELLNVYRKLKLILKRYASEDNFGTVISQLKHEKMKGYEFFSPTTTTCPT